MFFYDEESTGATRIALRKPQRAEIERQSLRTYLSVRGPSFVMIV